MTTCIDPLPLNLDFIGLLEDGLNKSKTLRSSIKSEVTASGFDHIDENPVEKLKEH